MWLRLSRAGWIFGLLCAFGLGCAPSIRPSLVQKEVDDARAALQAAETAQAPQVARQEYRQAERLLGEAIRQQQKGNTWQSYYIALRARAQSDLARAVAEEAGAIQRLTLARDGYMEARLEDAVLKISTAETLQKIAEFQRARSEADADASRRSAAAARSSETTTQQESARAVQKALAETELAKAEFLLDLALDMEGKTFDPEGVSETETLIVDTRKLLEQGDYESAGSRASDAYRVANETRLTTRTKQEAARQQAHQERVTGASRAATEIGKVIAILDIARKSDAPKHAKQPYNQAQNDLKQAQDAQRNGSYDDAVRLAVQAQVRGEEARLAAVAKVEQIRTEQQREEQTAFVRDTLARVQRTKDAFDDFTQQLSRTQLESVDGLLRVANDLLKQGNIPLAGFNADKADTLIKEAEQYAKDAKAAEDDILAKTQGVEGVSVFTAGRGVVLRFTKDLFASGRSDLALGSLPTLSQAIQPLRSYVGKYRLLIEAHTDRSGNATVNLRLSKARAASVQRHVVETLGLPGAQVSSDGYGDTRPIPDTSPSDAKNRRVEMILATRVRQ